MGASCRTYDVGMSRKECGRAEHKDEFHVARMNESCRTNIGTKVADGVSSAAARHPQQRQALREMSCIHIR